MSNLENLLSQHLIELENLESQIKKSLDHAPAGSLRITHSHNSVQYYCRSDFSNPQGNYIPKSQADLIQQLAQKSYNKDILPLIQKEKEAIKKLLQQTIQATTQTIKIYETMPLSRKQLITPYLLPENEFAKQWEQSQIVKKNELIQQHQIRIEFEEDESDEILSEKGNQVRSKSEKILADKFLMMGIPYCYELPLYLHSYGYIKPDFIVLNKRTRQSFYWEHLGCMDRESYCGKTIKKIETYIRNGIFPGKDLILTYETKAHPLNMKTVEYLIKEYLF